MITIFPRQDSPLACRRWSRPAAVSFPVALALALTAATAGQAQEEPQYDSLPIAAEFQLPDDSELDQSDPAAEKAFNQQRREIEKKRRATEKRAKAALEGQGGGTIEAWFTGFVLPEMTQTDDQLLSMIGEKRQRFFRNYLEGATNPGLRNQVIDLTRNTMQQVVDGNYHPSCRINAMLILGRLNAREGNRSELPRPLPEMLDYLLQASTSDQQPEYLRISALSGLQRHARLRGPGSGNELSADEQRRLGDAMVALIGQEPSDTLSREAVYWMKRRGIQTLGFMGAPGDNARYAKVLKNIIIDPEENLLVRTDAAEAYGNLDFADPADANTGEMIPHIGEMVIAAAQADADYLDQKLKAIEFIAQFLDGKTAGDTTEEQDDSPDRGSLGGTEGPLGGGRNQDGGPPEILPAYHREQARRRFKAFMWSGQIALVGEARTRDGGLFRYASPEDREFIEEMMIDFDNLMLATDVREPDPEAEDEDEEADNQDDNPSGISNEEEEQEPLTLADQLKKALTDGASEIQATIVEFRPEPEPAKGLPGAGEQEAPATDDQGG